MLVNGLGCVWAEWTLAALAWHAVRAVRSHTYWFVITVSPPSLPLSPACASSRQLIVCTITNYLSGGALNQPRQDPAWTFKSIPHEKTSSSLSVDSSLSAATSPSPATSTSAAATQAAAASGSKASIPPSYTQPEQPPHLHSSSGKPAASKQPPQSNGSSSTAPYDSELELSDVDADQSTADLPRWRQVLASTVRGWRYYFSSPVLPASLAYVLLYSNAMLSPGSLMTSLLTHRGGWRVL